MQTRREEVGTMKKGIGTGRQEGGTGRKEMGKGRRGMGTRREGRWELGEKGIGSGLLSKSEKYPSIVMLCNRKIHRQVADKGMGTTLNGLGRRLLSPLASWYSRFRVMGMIKGFFGFEIFNSGIFGGRKIWQLFFWVA